MQEITALPTRTVTLNLTDAQITQLLTAVQVRAIQACGMISNPRFSECDLVNQNNLRAQWQVAEELVTLVEQALR